MNSWDLNFIIWRSHMGGTEKITFLSLPEKEAVISIYKDRNTVLHHLATRETGYVYASLKERC